jgi:hypothetical protein
MPINKGSNHLLNNNKKENFISRRMLVQRRIQEEIHGNKTIQNEKPQTNGFHHSPSPHPKKTSPVERKTPNGRRSQSDERFLHEQQKKSPNTNPSIERLSSLTDDDEMSTNELVARNQSSKLDFHKTMTPMIGKENFELRKKLFEHGDESSFAGRNLLLILDCILFLQMFLHVILMMLEIQVNLLQDKYFII